MRYFEWSRSLRPTVQTYKNSVSNEKCRILKYGLAEIKGDEYHKTYETRTLIRFNLVNSCVGLCSSGSSSKNVSGTEVPRFVVEKTNMRVVMRIINQFIFSRNFHPSSSEASHLMQCTKVAQYNP